MTGIALTFFPSIRSAEGKRVRTTWEKLTQRLATARVAPTKDETPGLSIATYRGDCRSLDRVELVYAIGLDFDHLDAVSVFSAHDGRESVISGHTFDRLARRFLHAESFIHTTWQSTPTAPRARVFLPLSRPVTGDEYRRCWAAVAGRCERAGLVVDRQASDPSRFWFIPSVAPGATYAFSVGHGAPVDVDGALEAVPPPAAPVAPPRPASVGPIGDLEARVGKYLEHCEPAVSGSGGHNATFIVCQRVVLGFDLDDDAALHVLAAWNARCSPPWSLPALLRKIRQARERGTLAVGSLRDRDRRAS